MSTAEAWGYWFVDIMKCIHLEQGQLHNLKGSLQNSNVGSLFQKLEKERFFLFAVISVDLWVLLFYYMMLHPNVDSKCRSLQEYWVGLEDKAAENHPRNAEWWWVMWPLTNQRSKPLTHTLLSHWTPFFFFFLVENWTFCILYSNKWGSHSSTSCPTPIKVCITLFFFFFISVICCWDIYF